MKIKPILTYVIELENDEAEQLAEYIYQANETAVLNANPDARNVARQFLAMLQETARNYAQPPF